MLRLCWIRVASSNDLGELIWPEVICGDIVYCDLRERLGWVGLRPFVVQTVSEECAQQFLLLNLGERGPGHVFRYSSKCRRVTSAKCSTGIDAPLIAGRGLEAHHDTRVGTLTGLIALVGGSPCFAGFTARRLRASSNRVSLPISVSPEF